MKFQKKVLTTSIAATLALGSVTGLPLSSKGLLDKLGVQTALAANVIPAPVSAKITTAAAELAKDTAGQAAVNAAQAKLSALDTTKATYIPEVWSKVQVKLGDSPNYPALTQQSLLKLIKQLSLDPNGLEAAIANPDNREVLSQLASLAGKNGSGNSYTAADLTDFGNAFKAELDKQIKANILNLATFTNPAKAREFLQGVLANVLAQDLKISDLLNYYDIKASDLISGYARITQEADPDNQAQLALAAAYARTKITFDGSAISNSGRELTPKLTIWGVDIALLATWTSSNPKITYNGGKFVLNGAYGVEETAVVEAKIEGILIFSGTIKLKNEYQSGGTGPITPSIPVPSTQPDVVGPKKEEALQRIADNIANLEDLVKNPKAGNGLKKAQEAVEKVIREAAKVDVSGSVKVEGGVAKLNLDAKKLEDSFKTIKDIAKTANDKLKEVAPDAKPAKVTATLDLGTVAAATTEIPLAKEIVDLAKENGIDAIALKVNGVSLTVDVDQIAAGAVVTIKKQDKSAASAATKLKIASDVYEFDFTVGDSKIETFKKPVEVRLPVPNVDNVDSELLVFAKIDGGKLIFKGGSYDKESKQFVVANKSFSTYTIVENKVNFSDIASVKDWAGRQISVAAAKGILEGRADGEFVPNEKVTRGEFAKLIVKAFGLEDATATEAFTDVNDSDWFKPYVAAAVKAGIVQGRSADKFEPNATITRAELATMASRALEAIREYKPGLTTADSLKAFADAGDINASLKDGVALAAEQGVVIGEDTGKFNPNNDSTRAQAAVVIYRLLNK